MAACDGCTKVNSNVVAGKQLSRRPGTNGTGRSLKIMCRDCRRRLGKDFVPRLTEREKKRVLGEYPGIGTEEVQTEDVLADDAITLRSFADLPETPPPDGVDGCKEGEKGPGQHEKGQDADMLSL